MFREPSDDQIRRRVGSHARYQVIAGSIFAVFGVVGFIATRQAAALGMAACAVLAVVWWNPVRKKFDTDRPPRDGGDSFPGGRL